MELHAAQPFLANWILQNPAAGLPTLSRAIQLAQERILAGHPNMADMTVKRLVHPRVDLHRLSYPGVINSLLCALALFRPNACLDSAEPLLHRPRMNHRVWSSRLFALRGTCSAPSRVFIQAPRAV